ncbi:MAG: DNA-3-methyladenine glycosylase 2 family protein [Acidimicrobiia bacterium]|nr:DNA-3-methyladenine glycosylase 2 family protein [Acidimicrobiia bacterium]
MESEPLRRRFELPGPLDLIRTVGPLLGPSQSIGLVDRGEVWRASRTPVGSVTLHVVIGERAVDAEAWGEGADWALAHVPDLLGFSDDPTTFRPDHPRLRDLHVRAGGVRFGATRSVFEVLVPTILGQKVTTKESHSGYRRLVEVHGEPAPGPRDLRLAPSAEVLAELPYFEYHPLGIERKRADIIRSVAARIGRLEEIVTMNRDEAVQRLMAFEGIGPWTAAFVMAAALGDADAVPVGDFHLPNTVAWALASEPRADDARMLELLEPYRGHRGRVIRLLKQAGIHAPKYGPRSPIRSFEGS